MRSQRRFSIWLFFQLGLVLHLFIPAVSGLHCYNCIYNLQDPNGRSTCFVKENIRPCNSPEDIGIAVRHVGNQLDATWDFHAFNPSPWVVQNVVSYVSHGITAVVKFGLEAFWSEDAEAGDFLCVKSVGLAGRDIVIHSCIFAPFQVDLVRSCNNYFTTDDNDEDKVFCHCKDGKSSRPCNAATHLRSGALVFIFVSAVFLILLLVGRGTVIM